MSGPIPTDEPATVRHRFVDGELLWEPPGPPRFLPVHQRPDDFLRGVLREVDAPEPPLRQGLLEMLSMMPAANGYDVLFKGVPMGITITQSTTGVTTLRALAEHFAIRPLSVPVSLAIVAGEGQPAFALSPDGLPVVVDCATGAELATRSARYLQMLASAEGDGDRPWWRMAAVVTRDGVWLCDRRVLSGRPGLQRELDSVGASVADTEMILLDHVAMQATVEPEGSPQPICGAVLDVGPGGIALPPEPGGRAWALLATACHGGPPRALARQKSLQIAASLALGDRVFGVARLRPASIAPLVAGSGGPRTAPLSGVASTSAGLS